MARSRRQPRRQKGRGRSRGAKRQRGRGGTRRKPRRQRGRGKVGDFFRQTGKKVASVLRKLVRSRPARQATKRTVGALLKAGTRVMKTGSTKGVKQKLQSSSRRSGRKLTRDILKSC